MTRGVSRRRERRVRGTFLLKTIVLVVCAAFSIAVAAAVFAASMSSEQALATGVVLAVLWVAGIELDLLPMLIERMVARRASTGRRAERSLWFIDEDARARRDAEARRKDLRDNPSLW